jgi:hypothetical protein
MKTLLFIPFLFMSSMVIGQTYNSDSIIGVPIRIGNLEVAQFDFPSKLNGDYAGEECQALGKGWRLPTIAELNELYVNLHKKGIGGFSNTTYWSDSFSKDDDWRMDMSFDDGQVLVDGYSGFMECNVRAVRTIN